MKSMLLAAACGVAAMTLFASGAQAQSHAGSIGRTPERLGRIFRAPSGQFDCGSRHSRNGCNGDGFGGAWVDSEWALYNNRSWEADSYNDWWHDRPDRAYPAWMRRNQDCSRQWFSGDTLRC
jgi:hypothetical protein